MKIRITYRLEMNFEADDINDAVAKFEAAQLCPEDTKETTYDYVQLVSVEKGDNFEDITSEFNEISFR